VETDVMPLPGAAMGSVANYAGNAFVTRDTPITVQREGARTLNFETDRRWAITNPKKQHPHTGKNVGYSIMGLSGATSKLMALEDGWVGKRAPFARKPVWVVKDVETPKGARMWPSGKYVPQTREEPTDSIAQWVQGDDNLAEEDILLYLTMGVTHIPRPEDWPVMPAEHIRVLFRPSHFFLTNPSMDVPGADDKKSVAAFGGDGACCSN